MGVILMFDQYLFLKQQNDTHIIYNYNTEYTTKMKNENEYSDCMWDSWLMSSSPAVFKNVLFCNFRSSLLVALLSQCK